MIGGFEEPTEGIIYLGDRDVTDLQPYKRDVNTVFQSYALFPHLKVFENVAFGLRRRGVGKTEVRKRVMEMIDLVQLSGMERRKPSQCSGGQQQRVALARALVNKPQVLLLDEPLGALDLKLRKEMQLFIKGLQQEVGITFIHVTHDQEEAMTMADSIAVMSDGHIEQLGSPDDLYERPSTPFVARFLGVSNLLQGTSNGDGSVRLDDGTVVRAPGAQGRQGPVAVGIRPEKIRIGRTDENALSGEVKERAYIGVSTQYIVSTHHGPISVYVQNSDAGAAAVHPGDQVTLSWSPDSTFVVDPEKERNE
jgi:spermidine/putrescine transport system ATP-binding protein